MKKLFSLLGAAIAWRRSNSATKKGYAPYAAKDCNAAYNLLFCDKLELLRKDVGANPQGTWATLLAEVPYAAALTAIAEDQSQESRLRALAYNRLRDLLQPVPNKKLFAVIVELSMEEGLDVLATYADGRVRYINHKNSISIYEPVPQWMASVRRLVNAAQVAVDRTGPWEQPRIPPPGVGMVRMTFLVSDGLYFGQGVMALMEKDEMARPIISACVALLKLVTEADAKTEKKPAD